jgi:hypothetical protein
MAIVTQFPTAFEARGALAQFTNPANAFADDGLLATTGLTATYGNNYKTFGFDAVIPAGATINAVKTICKHNEKIVDNRTNSIPIVGGVDQLTRAFAVQTALLTDTNDHTSDRSWTRADLLDANFKVGLTGQEVSGIANANVAIDYIKVEVTYTAAAAPANPASGRRQGARRAR